MAPVGAVQRPAAALVGERQRVLGALRAIEGELRGWGVVGLRLFGSLARGDACSASDVDLLLSVAPGRRFSLLDMSAVRLLVVDRLGRDASVVVEADLTPAFRARIEADLVEIY